METFLLKPLLLSVIPRVFLMINMIDTEGVKQIKSSKLFFYNCITIPKSE